MNITLIMPNKINGAIQVDGVAKQTVDGIAHFDVNEGKHMVRALAMGFRGNIQEIEVTKDGQVFEVILGAG